MKVFGNGLEICHEAWGILRQNDEKFWLWSDKRNDTLCEGLRHVTGGAHLTIIPRKKQMRQFLHLEFLG